MNKLILTHAGSFHADEVMAVALLEKFMFFQGVDVVANPKEEDILSWLSGATVPVLPKRFFEDGVEDQRTKIPVIRTRNAQILKKASSSNQAFLIDVGGVFSEELLNFDHHQKSMKDTWEDGAPLSSTGLVWRYLKSQNKLSHLPQTVVLDIEERLIKPLDAHDNGQTTFPLSSIVASYNRETSEPALQDEQFGKALLLMKDSLENALFSAELKNEAIEVLSRQWQKAQSVGDTVVLLPKHIAYHDCAGLLKQISNDQADMIVIPGQGNRFSVISLGLDTPFSIKVPCPMSWRGKMDFVQRIKNEEVTIKFAHKSGFMCVVEGTHQKALNVGRFVVQEHKKHVSSLDSSKKATKSPKMSG